MRFDSFKIYPFILLALLITFLACNKKDKDALSDTPQRVVSVKQAPAPDPDIDLSKLYGVWEKICSKGWETFGSSKIEWDRMEKDYYLYFNLEGGGAEYASENKGDYNKTDFAWDLNFNTLKLEGLKNSTLREYKILSCDAKTLKIYTKERKEKSGTILESEWIDTFKRVTE